jgi:hypothetical protein
MSDFQLVIEAIRTRTVIEFSYGGFRRVYRPYILGETKTGEIEVFGWQALSGKGGQPEFRQFRLTNLSGLIPTVNTFERPSSLPEPEKRGFIRVIARV